MASPSTESQDRLLYKFTKILTLKIAQIVVQSRQGKKITHEAKNMDNCSLSSSPNQQWFNLSIPDEPTVTSDTKKVLNGGVCDALANVLCIEISLRTCDDEEMVLEMWTVKLLPDGDTNINSLSTIYYRMSIMLKSALTISRITPGYKMSRVQHKETYKVYHKIYGGSPNFDLLGEQYKTIKISEMPMSIGTVVLEVKYRTKMLIPADNKRRISEPSSAEIMVKSDHFRTESPKKPQQTKKELDLSGPLAAGAFVDAAKIKELHQTLSQQLPPEPTWPLADKENEKENKIRSLANSDKSVPIKAGCSVEASGSSVPRPSATKAIEVPKPKNGDKYTSLMEIPFADGSPITELADFYQECLQAGSASDEWTDILGETTVSIGSDTLSQQLKMYEDAVPEFDSLVESMNSHSENGSEN